MTVLKIYTEHSTEICIVLCKSFSPQYFPRNRISAFHYKLPKRISFASNKYKVALTEFSDVHTMKTYA